MNQLNYKHLEYFYWIAKYGNATRAAFALGVSQPTICAQIKVFEEAHGVTLFIKSGRGNVLTQQGKELFDLIAPFYGEVGKQISALLQEMSGREKPKPFRVIQIPSDRNAIYVDQNGREIFFGEKVTEFKV